MKRVKPMLEPDKVFRLSERQVQMAEMIAQYPEKDWKSKEVVTEVLEITGTTVTKQNVNFYQKMKSLFELAKYIKTKTPYKINGRYTNSKVYSGGKQELVWDEVIERFCWELVCDPAMSIIAAGNKVGVLPNYAQDLAQRPEVKRRIAQIKKERMERYKVEADLVLEKVMALALANFGDYIERWDTGGDGGIVFKDFEELTPDQVYPIHEIKKTIRGIGKNTSSTFSIKLESKTAVLNMLMKHLGLLDQGVVSDPRDTAQAIRDWASGVEDFVPGNKL